MVPLKLWLLGAAAAAGGAAVLRARAASVAERPEPTPFALVELFTSEGCSSCPPADALLAQAGLAGDRRGERVLPLSFHVDYWNGLGWRDPYSDAAYTARQHDYARALRANVYTPQAVVNGRAAFVGSDRAALAASVAAALAEDAEIGVGVTAEIVGEEVAVTYRLSKPAPGAVLRLALTESALASAVLRGENGGRILRHDHVVRLLRTVEAPPEAGAETFARPPEMRPEHAAVVAFLQDARTLRVLAAARASL